MEKIQNSADLKNAIASLEFRRKQDWQLLKDQITITKENLTIKNLIKSRLKAVASKKGFTTDIANTAIGLTTGFLSKKLLFGSSINPLKKLIGYALEMTVANKVMMNADGIKTVGTMLIDKVFKKKKDEVAV
jgi:hypothetical protein